MCHLDYLWSETLNCWRSVEAHCHDGAGSMSLPLLSLKERNTSVMTIFNQSPLRLPKMQIQTSLKLCWRSFPEWGKEHESPFFHYESGQYMQKEQWLTIINIVQLTVGYLNATINRTMQNAESEIGRNGSSQSQRNPQVDRYGWRFGPPRSSGLGISTGLEYCFQWFQICGSVPDPGGNQTGASVMGFSPSKHRIAPDLQFFGRFHNFTNSELWLQLSISVLIVSQCDIYVKDVVLHAHSPPIVQLAIRSIFVQSMQQTTNCRCDFTLSQRILIRLQIGEQEVKEHAKLHLVHIYHIVIQSELKYLFGAKVLSLWKWGSAKCKTWPKDHSVRWGSGL